ncbi:hypothetical protein AAG906_030531 [Vitis piasezkii]
MCNTSTNGFAEAFNKIICNLLKKIIDKSREISMNKNCTTLERQIHSLRIIIHERLIDEDNSKLHLQELEALDEK